MELQTRTHILTCIQKCMYSSGKMLIQCLFPLMCAATREINTKLTLEWPHERYVTRVRTSLSSYMTWRIHKRPLNGGLHTLSPCLTPSIYVARQLWRGPLKVISNSLDVNFIHCHIFGRSCKKMHVINFVWSAPYWIVWPSVRQCWQWKRPRRHDTSMSRILDPP